MGTAVRRVLTRQIRQGGTYRGVTTIRSAYLLYDVATVVGVGTVLVEGLAPTISNIVSAGVGDVTIDGGAITVTWLASAGVGEVNLHGQVPTLYYVGQVVVPAIPLTRMRLVTQTNRSGVHRATRIISRPVRYFIATQNKVITVGVGEITIQGLPVRLEEYFAFTGVGEVTVQGFGPAVFADGAPVASLTDAKLLAIVDSQRRRRNSATIVSKHATGPVTRYIDVLTRDKPDRVVGVGPAVISIAGSQPLVVSNYYPVGSGAVTISGLAPVMLIDGRIVREPATGVITIDGGAVTASTVSGLVVTPGVGGISIIGLQYSLVGRQLSIPVGNGALTTQGNQPGIIATGYYEKIDGGDTSWTQVETVITTWSSTANAETTWTKL